VWHSLLVHNRRASSPQGDCDSCTAYAVAAVAEATMASALRVSALDAGLAASELQLFACLPGSPNACSGGWRVVEALKALSGLSALEPRNCKPLSSSTMQNSAGEPR
jgi:hypothetical protein